MTNAHVQGTTVLLRGLRANPASGRVSFSLIGFVQAARVNRVSNTPTVLCSFIVIFLKGRSVQIPNMKIHKEVGANKFENRSDEI